MISRTVTTDLYKVPDAVPPIHAISSHVATDNGPSKFRSVFSDNLQPIATRGKKAHGTLLGDIGCFSKRAPLSFSYYNEISSGHIGSCHCSEEGLCRPSTAPVTEHSLAEVKECDTSVLQVCAILWSQHHRELISGHGYSQNQLTLWKYPSMTRIADLTGHTSRILALAMSPDGSTVASAAADETLRFWKCFEVDKTQKASAGKTKVKDGSGQLDRLTRLR